MYELREVSVDQAELFEVVEAFKRVGKAENQGAFDKEEDQRDGVSSLHFLCVLGRNGDWHKEGNKEVDKSLVMLHIPERWDKFVEKTDRGCTFEYDWNEEETRSVEETKDVDGYFDDQDSRPHEKH